MQTLKYLFVVGVLTLMTAQPAAAAIRIWDGGSPANDDWMTPANWVGDVLPAPGDALHFPSAAAGSTNNNFPAGTEFQSLTFAGNYGVSGNRILLASGISVQNDAMVAIGNDITLKSTAGAAIVTMQVEGANGELLLTGVVNGGATVTLRKFGSGELRLDENNTYDGPTVIDQGMLRIASTAALGDDTAGTTVNAGGVLAFDVTPATAINEPLVIAGEGTSSVEDGALKTYASITLDGPMTVNGAASPSIFVLLGQQLTIEGPIIGPAGLVKDGPGVLRFHTGAGEFNTYAGQTVVRAGTLSLAMAEAPDIPAGLVIGDGIGGALADIVVLENAATIAGGITVHSSGWLNHAGNLLIAGAVSMTGGKISTGALGQLNLGGNVTATVGGAPAVIEGRVNPSATHTFVMNGAADGVALDVTASIIGNFGLVKAGPARLRLAGVNSFLGQTTVQQGALVAGVPLALGNSGGAGITTVLPGGSVILETSVANERLVADTNDSATAALFCAMEAGCDWGGTIELIGGNSFGAGSVDTLRLLGTIFGSGFLRAAGGGTVELGSTNNSYAGRTVVQPNTTLRLNGGNRIPNASHVEILEGGILSLNSFSETIGQLSGPSSSKIQLGAGTLTIDAATASSSFHGVISGSGGLVKSGPNTLTLYSAQTYSGLTTVSGGRLLVLTSLAGPVSVTGGILGGRGHVGAVTTLNPSGRLEPGALPGGAPGAELGVLATAGLTLINTTTLAIDVQGPAPGTQHDQVKVSGPVSLNGASLALTVSPDLQTANLGAIVIVSNDSSNPTAGTFWGLAEGAAIASNGKTFLLTYKGGDGNDVALMPASREYYLSEGATGAFFDLDILIANPNTAAAPVTLTFLLPDGSTLVDSRVVPAQTRVTVKVDDIAGVTNTSVSTIVASTDGLPLVVERTMRWNQSGYGAHTEKAVGGTALNWYFAEGSQGFFSTYLLLANPQDTDNVATVRYLRENAPAVVRAYPIAAKSRYTVDAGSDPELVNASFGMHVTFTQPGVAERAMYFGMDPLWKAGHESAGVTAPSTTWFLAEGATGSFFETFVLLANPGDQAADVQVTFLPSIGAPVVKTKNVPAQARLTINIEAEDPSLANAAVATDVSASQPILVERAQYWPDPAPQWHEAHNSFGVTATGTKWGLAEGRVGGPVGYQTYILLANPGTTDAQVTITFLRESGAPFDKTFTVAAKSRFNVDTGVGTLVPELANESFGAVIVSDQPIAVERAMYSNANGQIWAAGTNATATALP